MHDARRAPRWAIAVLAALACLATLSVGASPDLPTTVGRVDAHGLVRATDRLSRGPADVHSAIEATSPRSPLAKGATAPPLAWAGIASALALLVARWSPAARAQRLRPQAAGVAHRGRGPPITG